jgi:3-keto-disaccharide hydrolase
MRLLRIAVLPVAAALIVTPARSDDAKPPEGFTALFNGKDLTGWKPTGKADVWGAEKGVIFVEKGGGGWLLTEKEYGDFELRLEYKLSGGANSGVALRTPREGDPAYVGMEIQLIDDEGWPGKLADYQHTGSIYDVVPASKTNNKPIGEWNAIRIVCNGSKVTVEVNGAKVVDANLEDYKETKGAKHPGLSRGKGHIGFQSYNKRVEFRNIFLKPL